MSGAQQGTLILICGLPGSGKTTLAKRLESERDAIRLCPDEWIEQLLAHPDDIAERDRLRDPVEDLQWDLAQTYLSKGLTVILEYGFWSEEERTILALTAVELGAKVELHYLEAGHDELWRRIQKRNAGLEESTWKMTREDAELGWRIFRAPMQDELIFYDDWEVHRGIEVELAHGPNDEVARLLEELEAELSQHHAPDQRHGLKIDQIFQPHIRFFVARREGRAAGCAGVAFFEGFAEVKRMYVEPNARGLGIADALMTRLEQEALWAGQDLLRLETGTAQAAAIGFYTRRGFKPCQAFEPYASMAPAAIETSLFFERRLNSEMG